MRLQTYNDDDVNNATDNDVDDNGDGATDDDVDDDCDGATDGDVNNTGDGAMGNDSATDDEVDDDGNGATWTTTMTTATARRDTMTKRATDINNDDDKDNDASLTGCKEGDNCNRNNGKDACALTAHR